MKQLDDGAIIRAERLEIDKDDYLKDSDGWLRRIAGLRAVARKAEQERDKEWIKWFEACNNTDAPSEIYSPMEYFKPYIRHSDWQKIKKEAEGK